MGQKERTCGGDRRSFFCVGGRDFCKSLYEYEKLMVIRYRIVVNIVCRNYRKKIKRMKEILTERETPERGRGELRNLYKIENYGFASVVCLCYIPIFDSKNGQKPCIIRLLTTFLMQKV